MISRKKNWISLLLFTSPTDGSGGTQTPGRWLPLLFFGYHPNRKPFIEFNSELTEDNIILTIEDNGLGIDLDKYGNDIFNLYRTFHNNENSEGVGLYLIKNQVESFSGEIEVESKVNEGSKFTITFPNLNYQD